MPLIKKDAAVVKGISLEYLAKYGVEDAHVRINEFHKIVKSLAIEGYSALDIALILKHVDSMVLQHEHLR